MNNTDQDPHTRELQLILSDVRKMIESSGFVLSDADWSGLTANDFGLGNLRREGYVFVDILRTARLRVTCIVLLPRQSLPEHYHPIHGGSGKEETLRVLHGKTRIYIPGVPNNDDIVIPPGKDAFYTARHELILGEGEQYTLVPPVRHWFQGGPAGSVSLTVQTRVDETLNVFTDPASTGCPISLSD